MTGLLHRAPNNVVTEVASGNKCSRSVNCCTTGLVYSAAIHAARNRGAREQTLTAKALNFIGKYVLFINGHTPL